MPLFVGDAYKLIRKIPDNKIHCVVTSPPYWGLRNYGNEAQIGLEPSPELFVRKFVLLFREIKRTLRNDGTIWLNMGDSYYGSGKGYGHNWENSPKQKTNEGSLFSQDLKPPSLNKHPYLKSKDLIGIPWRIAFALQEDGWYLRSDIIWAKTNSMPESVLDRPTRSHEYVFLLSKTPDYYFNHKAIQEDCVSNERDKARMKSPEERPKDKKYQSIVDPKLAGTGSKIGKFNSVGNGEKRNKRDVWSLATSQFKGAHFATMPEKLVEPCIQAGCPRGGIVLDPFAGAATVGVVAERLGRKFIGFELNPEYAKIAEKRLQDEREKLLGTQKGSRKEVVQTPEREAVTGREGIASGDRPERDFDVHL